jgi:hypothetical protein
VTISGAAIAKTVIYKEPVRLAVVSGIIVATTATKVADTPMLTDDDHVHLTVFSPFVSNTNNATAIAVANGLYQVFNVPYWTPIKKAVYSDMPANTWTWPF